MRLDVVINLFYQLIAVKRLGYKVIGLAEFFKIVEVGVGGKHDDRNIFGFRIRL